MQAFTAKGNKEEWMVTRNAHILDKTVTKTTERRIIRKHITTTYLDAGKALPAFYAEKRKAQNKGLQITNFDSTVKKPEMQLVKAVVKKAKVFGRYVPVEV